MSWTHANWSVFNVWTCSTDVIKMACGLSWFRSGRRNSQQSPNDVAPKSSLAPKQTYRTLTCKKITPELTKVLLGRRPLRLHASRSAYTHGQANSPNCLKLSSMKFHGRLPSPRFIFCGSLEAVPWSYFFSAARIPIAGQKRQKTLVAAKGRTKGDAYYLISEDPKNPRVATEVT